MSKREKLRRKLRNNPVGIKFSQLETLLLRYGFEKVRTQGSHHIFQNDEVEVTIIIPVHRNAVKEQYVRDAVDLIEKHYPSSEEAEEGSESTTDDPSDE